MCARTLANTLSRYLPTLLPFNFEVLWTDEALVTTQYPKSMTNIAKINREKSDPMSLDDANHRPLPDLSSSPILFGLVRLLVDAPDLLPPISCPENSSPDALLLLPLHLPRICPAAKIPSTDLAVPLVYQSLSPML